MAYWPPFFRWPRKERWLVQSIDDWWTGQEGSLASTIYTWRVVPTWQEPWTSGDPSLASGSPWTCPSSFSRAPCPWSGAGGVFICLFHLVLKYLFWVQRFYLQLCEVTTLFQINRSDSPNTFVISSSAVAVFTDLIMIIVTMVRNGYHRDHD